MTFNLLIIFFLLPLKVAAANLPPEAQAGENLAVVVGQEVIFDGSFSADPDGDKLEFWWNFDDGEKTPGQIVSHTFKKEGDYQVRLVVSDGKNEDEDKVKVTVLESWNALPTNRQQLTSESIEPENQPPSQPHALTVNQVQKLPLDSKIILQGVVIVEPGILAKTYFYLSSLDGSAGLQIYSYQGEFPKLYIGQLIEVQGITSRSYDITRVKINETSDITIIRGQDPPWPREIESPKINDDYLGQLIKMEGKILKAEGKIFVDQLRLEIKPETGLNKADLKEGELFKIAGILDKTRSGYRLLPRHKFDIEKVDSGASAITANYQKPAVLGEKLDDLDRQTKNAPATEGILEEMEFQKVGDKVSLPPNQDQRGEVLKYLLATAVALIVVLIGTWVKGIRRLKVS